MFNAAAAYAQPVTITGTTTLGPNATDIASTTTPGTLIPLATADITVSGGGTLVVNGRHTIRSLVVQNNGQVTHGPGFTVDYSGGAGTDVVNGMWLNVSADPTGTGGNVTLHFGSRINVSGGGFPGGQGPGRGSNGTQQTLGGAGGGYGGSGGTNGAPAGTIYGSYAEPTDLGSGGGASFSGGLGTPGGGAIRLSVSGVLTLSGSITANGTPVSCGNTQTQGGSGSGGSVWITAGSIVGNGTISAAGGGGCAAGGGGRVAVYSSSSAPLTANITANGGYGNGIGGPGTVYRSLAGQNATLIYDNINSNIVGTNQLVQAIDTPLGVDVIIRNGARFTHPAGHAPGLVFNVRGDLTIGDGGSIDVNGRGFPAGQGPGAGTNGTQQTLGGAGGGYGGSGGTNGAPAGIIYGSYAEPTELGSGGGTSSIGGLGSPGGGAVRLGVGGILTLSGSITANGTPVSCGNTQTQGGSGSGGSVWITAGSIVGNGTISAAGGGGCAAGGGGRVAVYSSTSAPLTANITANGGAGDLLPES